MKTKMKTNYLFFNFQFDLNINMYMQKKMGNEWFVVML